MQEYVPKATSYLIKPIACTRATHILIKIDSEKTLVSQTIYDFHTNNVSNASSYTINIYI